MIKVIKNIVAIAPRLDPNITRGGIIIPDIAKTRSDQGIVKYVGPDVEYIVPGDYVLFSAYDGTNIQVEGERELILLPEDRIVAILYHPNTLLPNVWINIAGEGEKVNAVPATYEDIVSIIVDNLTNLDPDTGWRDKKAASKREELYDTASWIRP